MSIGRNNDQTVIEERLKIQAATAAFLAKGGVINVIPRGVGAADNSTPAYNPKQVDHER